MITFYKILIYSGIILCEWLKRTNACIVRDPKVAIRGSRSIERIIYECESSHESVNK